VKYSTAKTILRIYQKDGRYKKKKRLLPLENYKEDGDLLKPEAKKYCHFPFSEEVAERMTNIVTSAALSPVAKPKLTTGQSLNTRLPNDFWSSRITAYFNARALQ
jgi:hypothetical protein